MAARLAPLLGAAGGGDQGLGEALQREVAAWVAAAAEGAAPATPAASPSRRGAVPSSPFADPRYNRPIDGAFAWPPEDGPAAAAHARACTQVAVLALALLAPDAEAAVGTPEADPSALQYYTYGDGRPPAPDAGPWADAAGGAQDPYQLPPGAAAARLLRLDAPALLRRLLALVAGGGGGGGNGAPSSAHAASVWVMGVLKEVAPRLGLLEVGVVLATLHVR